MRIEDLNLLAQLIEAEDSEVKELEGAVKDDNFEKIRKIKEEILNLQKQIAKILV